ICTDAIDRYHSVMSDMTDTYGQLDRAEALARLDSIFLGQKTDWIHEGTTDMRKQWHNLKYYTWVEQQGKSVEELNEQMHQEWWIAHQQMVGEIDKRITATR
ncbi:MAG TPA: pyridoxal-5'-phosphate-dependent protein subunit beta, partial [Anaerolineae bacterium]|nr:pyridoxal-5'-phosphate-dependent protein subunit beta [Anaerolineae bacterium]